MGDWGDLVGPWKFLWGGGLRVFWGEEGGTGKKDTLIPQKEKTHPRFTNNYEKVETFSITKHIFSLYPSTFYPLILKRTPGYRLMPKVGAVEE